MASTLHGRKENGGHLLGRLVLVVAVLLGLSGLRAAMVRAEDDSDTGKDPVSLLLGTNLVAVARPPFSEDVFPCSDCHDGTDVDTTWREVEDHEEVVFEHDAENRWCLDCHDTVNRDKLHLADGTLVDFTESYRLCGQCHGPKLRDWKVGEHGKRTGFWSGRKQYLLCVHCHDPHSPKFKPLEPLPPPLHPEKIR